MTRAIHPPIDRGLWRSPTPKPDVNDLAPLTDRCVARIGDAAIGCRAVGSGVSGDTDTTGPHPFCARCWLINPSTAAELSVAGSATAMACEPIPVSATSVATARETILGCSARCVVMLVLSLLVGPAETGTWRD
jgi:hypothetical protein